MPKLPEGMKAKRTQYGSTTYTYKGVSVYKRSDSYYFPVEYLVSETGRISVTDKFASGRLIYVPYDVNKYLEDENYYLDSVGVLRLTEGRKAELIRLAAQRITDELTACEEIMPSYLAQKNWKALEVTASRIQKLQQHWTRQKELVA